MRIGKAHVTIKAEGCVECGTYWSHGWATAYTLTVQVENRKPVELEVYICADCMEKRKGSQQELPFKTSLVNETAAL